MNFHNKKFQRVVAGVIVVALVASMLISVAASGIM